MLKNVCKLCLVVMLASIPFAYADNAGSFHFSTIGGSSMVGQMDMDTLDANMINDAAYRFNKAESSAKKNNNENINTRYNFKKSDIDTTNDYYEEIPCGGRVNASKTMYTDDLGRLHFFGKGNLVKSPKY